MIITISNQKGGVGKSTIAWNVAVELSKQTKKHLRILDLDAQKTLTMTNQLRNKKGLQALDLLPFDNDYVRVGLDAK